MRVRRDRVGWARPSGDVGGAAGGGGGGGLGACGGGGGRVPPPAPPRPPGGRSTVGQGRSRTSSSTAP
ncbi:hypothetical protein AAHZ94_18435, partial [Streptomyces sp. HSW2009]|uniref:hypothetical protein n=1 Tax=Streptomyces sp. HSW2009 TaxID=3142890 RepID=UPI0032EF08EA